MDKWQALKVFLSGEMERCKSLILTEETLSSDHLLRLHERIHSLANVKAHMETMETDSATTDNSETM
jgi:hypothetical protein